jgi:hypothetical protein
MLNVEFVCTNAVCRTEAGGTRSRFSIGETRVKSVVTASCSHCQFENRLAVGNVSRGWDAA